MEKTLAEAVSCLEGEEADVEVKRMKKLIWKFKGAGSFHDTRKTMKELSANDTSRYPKVVKIALNHGCQ